MVKIILPGSKKRQEPPDVLEDQQQKRQKMDSGLKMECRKILTTLMTHEFGPVFNHPVDPVALGIPDYFSIISHPMDLGTIKNKLLRDAYSSIEEFAADVRLTFSNAMRYNPPGNVVHLMAKTLNTLFKRHWESLEANMTKKSKNVKPQELSVNSRPKNGHSLPAKSSMSSEEDLAKKKRVKVSDDKSKVGHSMQAKMSMSTSSESTNVGRCGLKVRVKIKKSEETNAAPQNLPAKASTSSEDITSMTSEEKMRLKKELLEALRGELSGPLRGFLRKYCLINSKREKIESVFSSFGDDALRELKRAVKGSLGTSLGKTKEDHTKTQHEKETPEIKKREDKLDIEARIRAARAAKESLLENAKSELQRKRDKARELVEKMEKTVVMDDNLTFLRELEKLCQCDSEGQDLERFTNPLERFGLRLKEEYYGCEYIDDDDDDDNGAIDLEDGEIL